jgi:tetratricopeptide (TPR) repeat protein
MADSNANDLFDLAFGLFDQGRYTEALEQYTLYLQQNPECLAGLVNTGLVYQQLKQHSDSLRLYNKALKINDKFADALIARGVLHASVERTDLAIVDFSESIRIQPSAKAYAQRSNVRMAVDQYALAADDATKSIELDANDFYSHQCRGRARNQLCQFTAARHDLREAIRLEPTNAFSYIYIGIATMMQSEYANAIKHFDKVIELGQSTQFAYSERGYCHFKLHHYDQALVDLSESTRIDSEHFHPLFFRAALHTQRNQPQLATADWHAALAQIEHAIKREPTCSNTYTSRGVVMNGLQRYDEALSDLITAIHHNASDCEAHLHRGIAHIHLKNYSRALQDLDVAIALNDMLSDSWAARGLAHLQAGNLCNALADLDRALELHDCNADALLNRARLLIRLDRPAEALTTATTLIGYNSLLHDAWHTRAQAHQALHNYQAAIDDCNTAIQLDSSNPHYHTTLSKLQHLFAQKDK